MLRLSRKGQDFQIYVPKRKMDTEHVPGYPYLDIWWKVFWEMTSVQTSIFVVKPLFLNKYAVFTCTGVVA